MEARERSNTSSQLVHRIAVRHCTTFGGDRDWRARPDARCAVFKILEPSEETLSDRLRPANRMSLDDTRAWRMTLPTNA